MKLRRKGFMLPIVLGIVAILALAIDLFSERMLAEYRATRSMTEQLQSRAAARSGIEYVLACGHDSPRELNEYSSQNRERAVRSLASDSEMGFILVAAHQLDSRELPIGLRDESAKLNLNGLPTDPSQAVEVRQRLMAIPSMTPSLADAMMDWIDEDTIPRALGAENSWYVANNRERTPANRPIQDLAELLQVRGVDRSLLFGEDSNGNGWLDDNENDGALTLPNDNADGRLQQGLSGYLTVWGCESNYRSSGRRDHLKIDINQPDLIRLHDDLLPLLGIRATQFILSMRLEGPVQESLELRDSAQNAVDERKKSAEDRLNQQLDRLSKNDRRNVSAMRSGLDLNRQTTYRFDSLADLIGQNVLTIIDGKQQLLRSPWDASRIETALESIEAVLTTHPGPTRADRIAIQHASVEVLRSIPGMEPSLATAIVQRRPSRSSPTIAWLVRDGLLSLKQFRSLAPYMTARGDVHSGTSMGWRRGSATMAAIHFTTQFSGTSSRLLWSTDSMPLAVGPFTQGTKP